MIFLNVQFVEIYTGSNSRDRRQNSEPQNTLKFIAPKSGKLEESRNYNEKRWFLCQVLL